MVLEVCNRMDIDVRWSGKLASSRTDDTVACVEGMVQQDRHVTAHRVATIASISTGRAHLLTVLHKCYCNGCHIKWWPKTKRCKWDSVRHIRKSTGRKVWQGTSSQASLLPRIAGYVPKLEAHITNQNKIEEAEVCRKGAVDVILGWRGCTSYAVVTARGYFECTHYHDTVRHLKVISWKQLRHGPFFLRDGAWLRAVNMTRHLLQKQFGWECLQHQVTTTCSDP